MSHQVEGSFNVILKPVAASSPAFLAAGFATMSIDKQFHGALEASSVGEMLSYLTEVKGSAGYVALEKVSGTLDGKAGSFVLQHHGLMDRGQPNLTLVVVPDSATGELAGLSGAMEIRIEDGKHFYLFNYTLPPGKG